MSMLSANIWATSLGSLSNYGLVSRLSSSIWASSRLTSLRLSSFKAFLHLSGFVFKVSTRSSSYRKSSLRYLGCCYLRRCVLCAAVVFVSVDIE